MKKIERVLAIIVLLLEDEVVPAKQLAQRFSVDKRTIFRDIETIEMSGFPIVSHQGRNGGFSLISSFKLRSYTYSEEEKQDILTALKMKEDLIDLDDHQHLIKEKLQLLQGTTSVARKPERLISFDSPTLHRPEIESETKLKNKQINLALTKKKKISIGYVSNKGILINQTIHPYELMLMNGSWYIYSYCEKQQDFRYLKVTRIRKLTVLEKTFKSIDRPNISTETPNEIITLNFRKEDLGKLYDYYLESEIKLKDDHIEVSFCANQQQYIVPFLLMFGDKAKVISPEYLKEQHKAAIKELQKTY
ncbi:helix-turn-helix transcriptional regulator [Enterococcus wangshanyuanii]|uniref:Transcriptional regulator n=1 Tax=Enterococcus wangshanyuanii TaxID=2005703 RepID=A0ABQ1PTD6_9ENTE|nr:YafY family protein [Enterococcus wangshanyuanii]GGD03039.1 transcriptional regulator [Enterococcus wangshanyuanii]